MQWESEPHQETKTAWRHLWHQEEQEEVAQAVTFKRLTTHAASSWRVVTLVPVQDCGWGDDSKCVDKTQQRTYLCTETSMQNTHLDFVCVYQSTLYSIYSADTCTDFDTQNFTWGWDYCWHKHGFVLKCWIKVVFSNWWKVWLSITISKLCYFQHEAYKMLWEFR